MNVHAVYRRFQNYFRPHRMKRFVSTFGINDRTRIVDVGGSPLNWSYIPQKPEVTLLNISADLPDVREFDALHQRIVLYDGSRIPFLDRSFDVCYSNSVIEHVGDTNAIALFASELRRLAPRYYVQTPNKYFFAEPHFMCVFIHWLPMTLRRRLIRRFSIWGWVIKPDQGTIDYFLKRIRLLTVAEMRSLFPDAEIVRERFLGCTKSIIAMKR
jgi:Methyltransferase domain